MSIKIWSDSGFCLVCEHDQTGHYENCKWHPKNVNRVRYETVDRAFIFYCNKHHIEDGRVVDSLSFNMKYVFAYEGNVTDKKKLQWGRVAFVKFMDMLGRDGEKLWDEASTEEQLRWVRTNGGRYEVVTIMEDYTFKVFDISHSRGSFMAKIGQGFHSGFTRKAELS